MNKKLLLSSFLILGLLFSCGSKKEDSSTSSSSISSQEETSSIISESPSSNQSIEVTTSEEEVTTSELSGEEESSEEISSEELSSENQTSEEVTTSEASSGEITSEEESSNIISSEEESSEEVSSEEESSSSHQHTYTYQYDDTNHHGECTCGDVIEETPHDLVWTQLSPATCEESEILLGTCICGYETTKEGDAALIHNYLDGYDEESHWLYCEFCDYESEKTPHDLTYEQITPATCQSSEKLRGICDCGYTTIVDGKDKTDHAYIYDDSNPNTHYGECDCGETITENHSFTWTQLSPATCEESEILLGTCICGYETTKEGEAALDHSLNYEYNEEGHYQVCDCGYQSEVSAHEIDNWEVYQEATCESNEILKGVCICGYEAFKDGQEALGHSWNYHFTESQHYQVCACGEESEPSVHQFEKEITGNLATYSCECGYQYEMINYQLNYYNSNSWEEVYIYGWYDRGEESVELFGAWPGTLVSLEDGETLWYQFTFELSNDLIPGVIFNNGSNDKTGDIKEFENFYFFGNSNVGYDSKESCIEASSLVEYTTIYLDAGVWDVDSAWFAIYYWGDFGSQWAKLIYTGESSIYYVEINSELVEQINGLIFTRNNPNSDDFSFNSEDNLMWNKTGDLTYSSDYNLFTITSWDGQTEGWSVK